MTMVEVGGGRLFAQVDGAESGGPDAPWIILSNSLAADTRMWDPQITFLTQKYRVLRYDTRGHGRSEAPPAPYSFPMLVDDVVAIMDHHGIDDATFMGLSLGGMTGLGLALAHPERIVRLVCCDARADAPAAYVESWDERIAVVRKDGLVGILERTLGTWLVPPFREAHPEAVERAQAMILATDQDGWIGCAEALKTLDYLKDLGSLSVPTLYVVGAEDKGAPPAVMQAMAEATPGARLATVPAAAHLVNIDNADGFNSAITGFLGL